MQIKKLYSKLILILFCLVQAAAADAQCLPGWKYYTPITVKNNTSDLLNNYQVKLEINTQSLVSASKMTAAGDDIRIVDSATCTPLSYYIESGINTSSTIVWVKLPSLAANASKTIRLYYGNSSATAQSNGDSTFLIFDDFEGTALNTTKWGTYGLNNTYTVSNGTLKTTATLVSAGGSSAIIRSNSSFTSPITVESMVTDYDGYYPSIAILHDGTFNGYDLFYGDFTVSTGSMYQGLAYSNSGSYASNQTDTNNSPGTITGLWQLSVSSTGEQSSSWPGGVFPAQNTFSTPNAVQVAAGTLFTSAGSMTMDWLRARTYASVDATVNIGTESPNTNGIAGNGEVSYMVNIYPNPAKSTITVDLKSQAGVFNRVALIDMSGKTIKVAEIKSNSVSMSVENLPKGFYHLQLTGKNAIATKKVVVN